VDVPDESARGGWTATSADYVAPQKPGQPDAWSQEFGHRASQHLREVALTVPPAEIAELLQLEPSSKAVVRRRTVALDRRPVELADSWYPVIVAGGTALALDRRIKGGAPTLLAELGYTAAKVIEDVCAPKITREQSSLLFLPDDERLLELTRTSFDADGAPFEVSVMAMNPELPDGELRKLRYELNLI
jgi:DNA-binding GntR family transcriptional regulator